MRAQEFVSEIERIGKYDYAGGKDYLGHGSINPKDLRPLPGGSEFLYSIQTDGGDVTIKLWDSTRSPDDQKPVKNRYEFNDEYARRLRNWEAKQRANGKKRPLIVGKLTLEKPWDFPLPGALQVNTITTDEDYRGRGLAKAMYGIVLTILKRPLVAGDSQTPGGRQNWVSLASIPGVEMKGYVSVDLDALNPNSRWADADDMKADEKIIDVIMGKLGGQYIGTGKTDRHYFAFDVQPNSTGKELEAYVKQNLARVYNENYNTVTGLYAVWTGQ